MGFNAWFYVCIFVNLRKNWDAGSAKHFGKKLFFHRSHFFCSFELETRTLFIYQRKTKIRLFTMICIILARKIKILGCKYHGTQQKKLSHPPVTKKAFRPKWWKICFFREFSQLHEKWRYLKIIMITNV